jgi:hypothetical protein
MRPTTQNSPNPAQRIVLSSKQYRVAISKNGNFRHKSGFFSKLLDASCAGRQESGVSPFLSACPGPSFLDSLLTPWIR